MDAPTQVIIINHQRLVNDGLAARLNCEIDIDVVLCCTSGRGAIAQAQATRPDVALVDIGLVGSVSALEVVKQLAESVPGVRSFVLSDDAESDAVLTAFRWGAANYILKDISAAQLADRIREVRRGLVTIDPYVSRLLIDAIARVEDEHPLTGAEREVLTLVADGLTNDEIGALLAMSRSTVKRHLAAVYGKVGTKDRRQAVREAQSRGWIWLPRGTRTATVC